MANYFIKRNAATVEACKILVRDSRVDMLAVVLAAGESEAKCDELMELLDDALAAAAGHVADQARDVEACERALLHATEDTAVGLVRTLVAARAKLAALEAVEKREDDLLQAVSVIGLTY